MSGLIFYNKVDLLDPSTYGDMRIERITDYSFTSAAGSLPVSGVEMIEASKEYVVAFVKSDQGDYVPVVVLGVEESKNLYVTKNGEWNAHYIPGYVRRYPFASMMSKDEERFSVCIDTAYPGFGKEKGQALFLEDGSPSPLLEKVVAILQDCQNQMKHTADFCGRLARSGLLEARELKAKARRQEGGRMFKISGLYVVNEKKLLDLDDAIILSFFKSGELAWIYSHLISLSNLSRLLDRYFMARE